MKNYLFQYIMMMLPQILSGYLFYKVACCFTVPHKNILLRVAAVLSLTIVGNTVIFNEDPINVTYAMIGFFIVMLLGFRGPLLPRLSVVMVLYPIMTAWNFIFYDIGMNLFNIYNRDLLDFLYRVVGYLLLVLFWFGLYKMVCKRLPGVIEYLDTRSWFLVDIICLSPFISVIVIVIITPVGREWGAYVVGLTSILTSIAVFFLLSTFAQSIRTGVENSNLRLRNSYYSDLESEQQEIRRLRHDIRNHLSIVGGLLEGGEDVQALKYLNELTAVTASTTKTYCNNSVVNAVLNAKYRRGVEQGIDCRFSVDIGDIIAIKAVDICTIFANTLDNAIEAAFQAPNPLIIMKARCAKGYFSYNITNTKVNKVENKGSLFLTSKNDKKNHGLGLSTVTSIVEGYGGNINIEHTDSEFTIMIIIKV